MSTKQLFGSIGFENMRRNSRFATSFSMPFTSAPTATSVSSSFSPRARAKSSFESERPDSIFSTLATVSSSARRSLPSSCARLASDQMPGSSSVFETSTRRDFFAS
jgi:hypothetical protein